MERAMQPGVLSWSRSAGFLFIQCSVRYGAVGKVISESRLLTIGREFFLQAPFFDVYTYTEWLEDQLLTYFHF